MPADVSPAPLLRPFDWSLVDLSRPEVTEHDGILVVRDDLIHGGTKMRYIKAIVNSIADDPERQEVVFAGPAQGALPLALTLSFGERVTLWYPQRKVLTPRQRETLIHGARHIYSKVPAVRPSWVKKRALSYCEEEGALCIRWSLSYPEVVAAIAKVCRKVAEEHGEPDHVVCAGGGGTLTRGLCKGFPNSAVHSIGIGRNMLRHEVGRAIIHPPPAYTMDTPCKTTPPFSCDRYYDAKAWEYLIENLSALHTLGKDNKPSGTKSRILFWNVISDVRQDLLGAKPSYGDIPMERTEYR